jgi:hypothetical protein
LAVEQVAEPVPQPELDHETLPRARLRHFQPDQTSDHVGRLSGRNQQVRTLNVRTVFDFANRADVESNIAVRFDWWSASSP